MATNAIPKPLEGLIPVARRAKAAATDLGAIIGILQNTGERIGVDIERLVGNGPDDAAPVHGAQAAYSADRSAWALSRKQHQTLEAGCRQYCRTAVNLLRTKLGNYWNSQWEAAGFTQGSLAIPKHPAALLTTLTEYYAKNPAHESVEYQVSAARSHELGQALENAAREMDAKKAAQAAKKQVRDAAAAKLRRRLGNLREELSLLLEPDDVRWYEFGFNRPADVSGPDAVEALAFAPGLPGEVRVSWEAPALAESYRVKRQIVGVDEKPVLVGLFNDPQAVITGLPSGAMVKVFVSAKNRTGESIPVEGQTVAP